MPNKVERFTQRSRLVLSVAQQEAQRLEHDLICAEHILLAMLLDEECAAASLLKKKGVELSTVRDNIAALTIDVSYKTGKPIDLDVSAKKVLEYAVDEARRMLHYYIGTEHLLLGVLAQPETIAYKSIQSYKVQREEIRYHLKQTVEEFSGDTASALRIDPINIEAHNTYHQIHSTPFARLFALVKRISTPKNSNEL